MSTEATKHDKGKTEWNLLPMDVLEECAHVFANAYKTGKYEKWNWTKGTEWSRIYNAAQRHLINWYRGDLENGNSHLINAICNLLMLATYEKYLLGKDDRLEWMDIAGIIHDNTSYEPVEFSET